MKNIGKTKVLSIPIGIPPAAERQRFETIVRKASATVPTVDAANNHAEALFASLQARAFRGEL